MNYAQLLHSGRDCLEEAQICDAGSDAWLLMEYLTGMTRKDYLLHQTEEVKEKTAEEYRRLLGLRARRIPLQHITGIQYFMGFPFSVTKNVLIPRQETELLVQEAQTALLSFLEESGETVSVLDVCTGSGCIAISLALLLPQIRCWGSDVSEKALEVARRNAAALDAEVTFLQSDLFEGVPGKYDCIVSNPPYIPSSEIETLEPEVREYDPLLALDGGADGLAVYRRLICSCPAHLKDGGVLLLEIGHDEASRVCSLLSENGFAQIRVLKDLQGLDRVVSSRKENINV